MEVRPGGPGLDCELGFEVARAGEGQGPFVGVEGAPDPAAVEGDVRPPGAESKVDGQGISVRDHKESLVILPLRGT